MKVKLIGLFLVAVIGVSLSVEASPKGREDDGNGDSTTTTDFINDIPIPSFPTLSPGQVQGAPILPYPNGPFYGLTFDPQTTWDRMLPLSVSGTCEGGKVYTIKSVEDFAHYSNELECVFNAASAPAQVPEGPLYGKTLSAVNTRLFNQFADQIWKGALINKTECNGTTTYIGWNHFLENPLMPFIASIKPIDLNLAPGENNNGKAALVLDYSQDITQVCPEYGSDLMRNAGRVVKNAASWATSLYPTNQIEEAVRYVGKTEDGKLIYLGKTYLKDAFRDDKQAVTLTFFTFVSDDKDALPVAISGLPLPPQTHSFRYMFPGAVDLMMRLNPLDNLISAPVRTFEKLINGVMTTGRNSFLFGQNLPFGFQRLNQNVQRFRNRFYNNNFRNRNQEQNGGNFRTGIPQVLLINN